MSREFQPTAPASLPKYLADGLPKQDVSTLKDAQAYIDELIEWQQRPVEPDDLPDSAETVEDDNDGKGVIVEEYVKCGDDTCHCAEPGDSGHGPYKYRYWREDGELQCKYVENE